MVDEICKVAISLSDEFMQSLTWLDFVKGIADDKQELINYLKEKRLGLVVFNIYLELISCRCISKALTEIFISQIHTHSEAANKSNPIPNIKAAMICHEI